MSRLVATHSPVRRALRSLAVLGAVAAAAAAPRPPLRGAPAPALKDVFRGAFLVGVAVNDAQYSGRDTAAVRIIRAQFNSISPENVLKWEVVHPRPGVFAFDGPDRYVAFGERNGMFVIGHNLVWHQQTPRWVFEDSAGRPVSRDTLLGRMREHIHAVVGRYRGRIKGWDVVNEALAEDGSLRDSPWRRIVGDDFLVKAFQYAHEADPSAELYYNDYALENAPKRAGAVALVRRLKAAGVPIHAIGTQEHNKMTWPTVAQIDSTITALAATGVRVNVTELDVDVLPAATRSQGAEVSLRAERRAELDPYTGGLPDSVQGALARRYAELFGAYLKHQDVIDRVTFWNVTDRESWLNDWPVPGRTAYPLLFDRRGRAKPAFDAVVAAARGVAGAGWVATWAAAQQLTEPRNLPPAPGLAARTLRQVVHVSVGGRRARVRFSNVFGDGPVLVGAAHLARPAAPGAVRPETDRVLTFGGDSAVTIRAGEAVVSDAFDYAVAPLSALAVTVRFAGAPGGVTGHPGSRATSYLGAGAAADAATLPNATPVEHWYVLAGVDVVRDGGGAAVVALGNSITDGRGSGTDRNDRWPDDLARRLQADPRTAHVAVLNAGIGGNCVVRACVGPPALERLQRDVFDQSGVRWLLVLEGVNDIGGARGPAAAARVADDLVAAYRVMIARAHARGLRVYGATILPFGGSAYDAPEHEAARQTVNRWIRTSGAFDAVVDFDAATRDPADPTRLAAAADGGDHLHPNARGYQMMADAIDPALFGP